MGSAANKICGKRCQKKSAGSEGDSIMFDIKNILPAFMHYIKHYYEKRENFCSPHEPICKVY